jgi:hypothetical protein
VGITPTLNPATKDANPELRSGCRIVAETLNGVGVNIEESGVAEVWRDHGEEILAAVGSICWLGLNPTVCAVRAE